jgi:phospholipid/cholesterol/gamma-HCH transport system substrate-binding protein
MMQQKRIGTACLVLLAVLGLSGCSDWRGANSLPLPGTEGSGL